ncbi:MAG: metalloregulator ArsR/SmtB family transcription factor [Rhodothermales bacterium]
MPIETVFAAVGDATRREIVEMLSRSDATVNELAAPFEMSLQAVAKHVRILQEAGIIKKKKIGRSHHCSLNRSALNDARDWMAALEKEWMQRLDRLDDFLKDEAQQLRDEQP